MYGTDLLLNQDMSPLFIAVNVGEQRRMSGLSGRMALRRPLDGNDSKGKEPAKDET